MKMDNLNALKRGRLMYIFEAAVEYLISILVAGSFLATLTKELGMSDSLTGILSSIISLGCLFQLLSLLIRKDKVKKFVVVMSVINQLMFMLLYVILLTTGEKQFKIGLFVIIIIGAYVIYNFAHPKKINWLMSLVEDSQRGTFTAKKEMISLIAGMIFSYGMGAVVDYFAEKNQVRMAFIISAIVIFVLMILHTVSMVLTVEKPIFQIRERDFKKNLVAVLRNKDILMVTFVFVLYNIATYVATPFYGTYQINELGFSLKFVSVLTICSSVVRIFVSLFWGKYADRKSFAHMIEKCLILLGAAYCCAALAVPSNGKIMFLLYYIFYGMAQGGINSALINLIYDYVMPEQRADSLAICQAAAGVTGFVSTLLVSPMITMIQNNGNQFGGMMMYAQQLTSVIGLVILVVAVFYVRFALIRRKGD